MDSSLPNGIAMCQKRCTGQVRSAKRLPLCPALARSLPRRYWPRWAMAKPSIWIPDFVTPGSRLGQTDCCNAAILSSSGGWLIKIFLNPCATPLLIPKAANSPGSACGSCARCSARSAEIIFCRPANAAPPASARNSRCLENHITIAVARKDRQICAMIWVT